MKTTCLASVLLLAAFGFSDDTATVTVEKPNARTLRRQIEQPGTIEAFEQAPLQVRISGYVSKVHKDIGDPVKKGELLAELSVPEMDEELKQKEALVIQAKAEVRLAQKVHEAAIADVTSYEAKVTEAKAAELKSGADLRRAESQFERLKKSAALVTREVLDEAQLGQETAKAALAEAAARVKSAVAAQVSAEARRDRAKADIAVAEAKQKVAEADQRRMAELVNYARIIAPFAGVVTKRTIDPGHFLQPTEVKREAAFVVARTDLVRIFVDVAETDASLVNNGTSATVSVPALNGLEFKGEVKRTSWALDARSRTLRVEIDLKNSGARLRPGMYVHSFLTAERVNVPTLPASAVLTQGDRAFCYLLADGKAVRTPVKTGLREGDFIEVLVRRLPGKQGEWVEFTGNERVIVSNPAGLTDGQAVRER